MALSGIGVAYSAAGFVLLWSGFRNATIKDTLTSFLKGQAPTASPTGSPTIGLASDAPAGSAASSSSVLQGGATGTGAKANQAIARALAASYGWGSGQEWADLVSLWGRESGWSNTADTRKSGLDSADASVFAYGIPQARPYSKMPKSAWPADKGGSSNSTAQISWGLAYLKDSYGSPSAAWAHEEASGWY